MLRKPFFFPQNYICTSERKYSIFHHQTRKLQCFGLGFFVDSFCHINKVPFYFNIWEFLSWVVFWIKCIFCIYWDNHMFFSFFPTNVMNYMDYFIFWLHHMACRIPVPSQGSNPWPLKWRRGVLTIGECWEVPVLIILEC